MLSVLALLLAIDLSDCDARLQHLGTLYEIRSAMMRDDSSSSTVDRIIDDRIEQLRGPLPGGEYRWVRWVRPAGDPPVVKRTHEVAASEGRGDRDRFEASSHHAFAVRIVVPRKRSLLKQNNAVYVGTAKIHIRTDGRTRTQEERINQWMNPDTARTIELGGIANDVEVAVDVATKPNDVGEAVAEIHFRQAVSEDDPKNPAYTTIQALRRIGNSTDARTIDSEIAALERQLFPGAQPLPMLTLVGELRRADELMRSSKPEDVEKGEKLLQDVLQRLR